MEGKVGCSSFEEYVTALINAKALKSKHVIEAFRAIDRAMFMSSNLSDVAYLDDSAIRDPDEGIHYSSPQMVAFQMEQLDIKVGMKCLDIGCGGGYSTALMSVLCGPTGIVTGIDVLAKVVKFAQSICVSGEKENNPSPLQQQVKTELAPITLHCQNCFLPGPATQDGKRYDRILVGATCPRHMIAQLLALLDDGGVMLVPIGDQLVRFHKKMPRRKKALEKLKSDGSESTLETVEKAQSAKEQERENDGKKGKAVTTEEEDSQDRHAETGEEATIGEEKGSEEEEEEGEISATGLLRVSFGYLVLPTMDEMIGSNSVSSWQGYMRNVYLP